MPTINRVHGQASAGAFYGYSPLAIKVADSGNNFTADTVNATTGVITEGGYSKAVKAIQTLGSIVLLGARTDGTAVSAIVDAPSFNQGAGAISTGTFGALKDAIVLAGVTSTVTNLTITSGSVFANTAAFTLS
jgi:hypothetical protein